ncbi:hypothetical protein M408DRAFT_329501 [Serendipita vermifera MAFF 305830]|uniref:Ribosomal RNA-processing protein 40 n=1 Tax=Serendipita vermifera MAFF 305830 TaxID=933852 RepID=A0A0C3B8H1_SERVB|nr:hypothetical protein M408DRAFT_329501 [Serendipita vermifera MAFF 305830]
MSIFVLPGDLIVPGSTGSKKLKLGPGLVEQSSAIVATRAGTLHSKQRTTFFIDSDTQRYVPASSDPVIGTITARQAESYRVDIGSASPATLDFLAFEGASKRNRPSLRVGSLVYARVSVAQRHLDPEIQCYDATTGKSAGFGELKGGMVIKVGAKTARSLLSPTHFLLPLLGAQFPLEVATGVNGRVWLSSVEKAASGSSTTSRNSVKNTIAAIRCVQAYDEEGLDAKGILALLASLSL